MQKITNIPTDLLRTLIAVVELRSFTQAAASLGLTQPAVSAQIKRLQLMLDGEIFDRSVQGISLTPNGEIVVSFARRLLSINDQIVQLGANAARPELMIRVGTSGDYASSVLPRALARFRERWTDVRFIVRTTPHDALLRELRNAALDVVASLSLDPPSDAHYSWPVKLVWVRGANTRLDSKRPVPLISYGESCAYRRQAITALQAAGLLWEDAFTGPSYASLTEAVTMGLGIMAVAQSAARAASMTIWEDAPLPELASLYCGIYVRDGSARSVYEQVADEIAVILGGSAHGVPKLVGQTR